MKLHWVGALFTLLVRYPVHKPVRTRMYGLPLSQSDQRIRSVFQSVYNNSKSDISLIASVILGVPEWNFARNLPLLLALGRLPIIVYWLKYAKNCFIWLAEWQSVHRRTDWRMDRQRTNSKQRSNSVKFHLILFYFGTYTIKLLLTEISVHTGNICFDIQGFSSSSSVNKSILFLVTVEAGCKNDGISGEIT